MKQLILITGMHRSGTSFLARALNLAGVYLGELDSLTSNEWKYYDDNLRGHWENKKFLELGEKTLSQNNGSWENVPTQIQISEELGKEITKCSEEFMNHPSIASGFKDPRITLNLDSWLDYLPKNIVIIGIFRHPLKVAESLKKRDNFSYEKSFSLWKIYNEKLVSILEKHNGFLLNFDWPKDKLFNELNLIVDKLGLIKNPDFSQWYSAELLDLHRTFNTKYKLSNDLIDLYSKLQEREKKNVITKIPKTLYSKNEITKITQGLYDEINNQGKYFKKLNEENLHNISKLTEENQQQESKISKLTEENQQQESKISKLTEENQQQESKISKLTEENQQQNSTNEELKSDLKISHKLINKRSSENQLLEEEIFKITNSISWGIILKTQRSLSYVFPPGTRRGNFLSLVIQFMKSSSENGLAHATRMAFLYLKRRPNLLDPNFQTNIQLRTWKDSQNFNELDINKMKKIISEFKIKPKISIIMPVFNVDEKWLRTAIDSVREQIYENWELCIVDDASTHPHIKPVITEYGKKDPRIKIKFLHKNKNIAGASNEALSLVTGDYVGLLDHDDELYQNTLFEVVKAINQNNNLQIIYSDENHISPAGQRIDPFFKPDYSPDLLMTCHYMTHFMVYATSLLRELNGFRDGFDGAQDYDLVLRAVEKTNMIHHIPKLLYGWRNISTSTAGGTNAKPYAQISAKKALTDALKRRKINGTPEYIPDLGYFKINYNLTKKPLVSIIITTRDRPDLLSRLISSIERKTTYDNYEIIIVDHLNKKKKAVEYLKSLKYKIIRYEKEFNISNLFNFAEKHANGEYLLTMNDDLEVITENWIESMLGPCQRDEVGIVGAQLIYPEDTEKSGTIKGQTIQHAGVVLALGGVAGHAFRHVPYLDNGYFALNKTIRNYSAVTGSCMLVKRDIYRKVNGYDPLLKVALNDVDFCLRVRKAGYLIVYTPYAKLYHYEGASRGIIQPSENTKIFVNKWKNDLIKPDPYYNPNLTLLRENFSLSFSGIPVEEVPLAFLLEIYSINSELQKLFPEVTDGHYENLIKWAATTGPSDSIISSDSQSNILSLYNFWYRENSKIKEKTIQKI